MSYRAPGLLWQRTSDEQGGRSDVWARNRTCTLRLGQTVNNLLRLYGTILKGLSETLVARKMIGDVQLGDVPAAHEVGPKPMQDSLAGQRYIASNRRIMPCLGAFRSEDPS
jgi:hypothetical protein